LLLPPQHSTAPDELRAQLWAAPVAIANAVMDALAHVGVRHIDTPLTPEKIWQALHGKEA